MFNPVFGRIEGIKGNERSSLLCSILAIYLLARATQTEKKGDEAK